MKKLGKYKPKEIELNKRDTETLKWLLNHYDIVLNNNRNLAKKLVDYKKFLSTEEHKENLSNDMQHLNYLVQELREAFIESHNDLLWFLENLEDIRSGVVIDSLTQVLISKFSVSFDTNRPTKGYAQESWWFGNEITCINTENMYHPDSPYLKGNRYQKLPLSNFEWLFDFRDLIVSMQQTTAIMLKTEIFKEVQWFPTIDVERLGKEFGLFLTIEREDMEDV